MVTPHPDPDPSGPGAAGLHSPALAGASEVVGLVRRLAEAQGRDDLAGQLDRIRGSLTVQPVRVLFIGGPQQGKSSVVNALAGAPVCPVGPGLATSVPVELHYAPTYRAELLHDSPADPSQPSGPASRREVTFAEGHSLAAASVNEGNRWRLRGVELGVPSATLQRGLCLVDTPAVTAVWSPEALRLVDSIGAAAAVVLVSTASAELTPGELDLLRVAHGLCQRIIVAVNGTGTFPQWPSVVERNQLLLERAGISATVVAVDAAPYWSTDGGLPPGPDSGMRALRALLDESVLLEEEQNKISRALTETFWAADRLRMRLLAERSLIGDDAALDSTIVRLRGAAARANDLCGADAAWARALADGLRQLTRDITTDLDTQLRQLTAEAHEQATRAGGDPALLQAWLHERTSHAVVRFQRVRKLSLRAFCDRVAQQFRTDWGAIVAALDISPEAHALLYPRLDRPPLAAERPLGSVPLPLPTLAGSAIDAAGLADQWIVATDRFLRADTALVLDQVQHELDARCRYRASELHRSLVEVLTSLTVLRGVAPAVVEQRQELLSSDIARLTTLDWRMSDHRPDELGTAGAVDLRTHPG